MRKVRTYHNATCLKCDNCFPTMVIVGPMVFDESCFTDEFGTVLEVDTQNKKYQKWLKKHKNAIATVEDARKKEIKEYVKEQIANE